jgi:DNA-binding transcriptional regulator YiaG
MSQGEQEKPLVWLCERIKTPPVSKGARLEAGFLLRQLQDGESLSMPESRPMSNSIGPRCHELRIRDVTHNWRVIYRIDTDDRHRGSVPEDDASNIKSRHRGLQGTSEVLRRDGQKREQGDTEMNKEKREALEAAGWVFGNAEDFLELTQEERCLVELRLKIARGIRTLRKLQKLTQGELARKMKTSQPRVAQIEAGSAGVSLDQMISGYIVLGGSLNVILHDEPVDSQGRVVSQRRPQGVKARKVATAK